ncbi:hypothetical protein HCN44_002511 [Aphidius gifuensis]|uniref:Peptidase S1 domain-containing protein n=1 Tax=Aphidius gifuensis TaxID=684658 RepID=A0A834Y2M2_APHGI|nr:hypothetical protein HCN44_002511 [Aphidius gifuensis]
MIMELKYHFYSVNTAVQGKLPSQIYGGEMIEILHHQYQASIQYQKHHICGATIISYDFLLTSASCFTADRYVYYVNLQVLVGTNDITRITQPFPLNVFEVSHLIIHEDYNPHQNWINDIALLKVTSSMSKTFLRLASMPTNIYSSNLHLIGWGENPFTGKMTRFLQKLDIKSITPSICKHRYDIKLILSPTQFCLIPRSPTAQITQGVSGTPVVRSQTIIGLVSLMSSKTNDPVIYTAVFPYINWINRNIKKTFK